ncbi:hypothetical protein AB0K43_17355 [Kitasatospora sp. NPDC049258]|uniref:hypothetical protein n=1 Tax=Kitasatospora sp. NPDC049258 TaxID=3155394 RepID=UPI0034121B2A
MNLRALTRGDAAVAGAAVLLFVFSFLPFYEANTSVGGPCESSCSYNVWHSGFLSILATVFLTGLAAAALILLARFQGEAAETRLVAGLKLRQWGLALSVFAAWGGLWALFTNGGGYLAAADKTRGLDPADLVDHSFGAWLSVLAVLVLAGAAVATPLVPALQAPLLTDKPAAPPQQQGYAPYAPGQPVQGGQGGQYAPQPGQVGQPGQAGQYGYPGTPVGQGDPVAAQAAGYAAAPPAGSYGYPAATQPQDQVPAQVPAPEAAAASFTPFWFAVPAVRPLAPRDNPAGPSVGELVPGTWYLAVEQRGSALVAQLQDGTHGLLSDTTGIQRG